jgi:hypothetical protein
MYGNLRNWEILCKVEKMGTVMKNLAMGLNTEEGELSN